MSNLLETWLTQKRDEYPGQSVQAILRAEFPGSKISHSRFNTWMNPPANERLRRYPPLPVLVKMQRDVLPRIIEWGVLHVSSMTDDDFRFVCESLFPPIGDS